MAVSTTRETALLAREASRTLGTSSLETRNATLEAMAQALTDRQDEVLAANQRDIEAARADSVRENLIDRLALTPARIADCAAALRELKTAPDPLGEIVEGRTIPGGIQLKQVRVPLGVIGMIYEARPNVTVDAAGIGIKTGNAMVLRGGSLAKHSNAALTQVLRDAIAGAGLPADCVVSLDATDRESANELMAMHGVIDVLIPRGGASLISTVVQNSKVPTIETGTGNCHVYVDRDADLVMAERIILNAKVQRPSVCNAAESLLVDREGARASLAATVPSLVEHGVEIVADAEAQALLAQIGVDAALATEDDFYTEFLDLKISVGVVDGVRGAIEHINRYGSGHSEAIVTESYRASQAFTAGVDAATVYVNASTRFTDGGMFGLGAEIGISTQKLHARGPMGLTAMTSTKYILHGNGQVRG